MFWIVFVILTFQALCIVILVRNEKTYRYSTDMLNRVSAKAKADIRRDRDWHWRYDEFNAVSHSTMVLKFWKPLRSFYPKDPAREDR